MTVEGGFPRWEFCKWGETSEFVCKHGMKVGSEGDGQQCWMWNEAPVTKQTAAWKITSSLWWRIFFLLFVKKKKKEKEGKKGRPVKPQKAWSDYIYITIYIDR